MLMRESGLLELLRRRRLFRRRGRAALSVDDFGFVGNLNGERRESEEHDVARVGARPTEQRVRAVETVQNAQNA